VSELSLAHLSLSTSTKQRTDSFL